MCVNPFENELSLLKTIKSEVLNSKNKRDALNKISGWILVLEMLENAMPGQPPLEVLPQQALAPST